MSDSDSADLLAEIAQKRQRYRWWPSSTALSIIAMLALIGNGVSPWFLVPLSILLTVAIVFIYEWDQLKKSVVLMYDLDGAMLESFRSLFGSIELLSRCGAIWHISGRGDVYDQRYHAGAETLLKRTRISIVFRSPPYVKTNVSVPCLPLGRITLFLLPDRVLAYTPHGVGAVDYSAIELSISPTRFIEEGYVPHDAKVVEHTWRFLNKNGTPDRRFNNNRQIPVCQYEQLQISSSTGLLEVMQLSRLGATVPVDRAIANHVTAINDAQQAEVAYQRRQETERLAREIERQKMQEKLHSPPPMPRDTIEMKRTPTASMLHQALFQSLCCIMVADGRASQTERVKIMDVMRKMKSGWTESQCDAQIDQFIVNVKKLGYPQVLGETLAGMILFRNTGHEAIALKCIEVVAMADGNATQREREIVARIAKVLDTTPMNLPP